MKKRVIAGLGVLVVAAVAYGFLSRRGRDDATSFRFVDVEQGDLESIVSATGTLSAVTTVQVGTQVSGIVSKINVDFNDHVTKGEVIAQIDTTLLDNSVRDAEAELERSKADLWKAQQDLDRLKTLHQQGIAADADYNTAQYNFEVATASVKSADVNLARAKQNLAYATITAPVSGTVVERDVDVGQTVAASLSAPKLFLIANDLSEMQILAAVDESDIGQIKEGQTARFTVKAYPDKTFTGTVKQVRLQSSVDQNVVSYTVVIDVKNTDHTLLPGMTATVEFLVATAKDVLKVPNAALRFRPSDAMMKEIRERFQREREARMKAGEGAAGGRGENGSGPGAPGGEHGAGPFAGQPSPYAGGGSGNGQHNGSNGPRNMTLLYYLDSNGQVAAVPVRTGITDGQFTEIHGRAVEAGMKIITGVAQGSESGASANPFQGQRNVRHGPPGAF